jgi:hypothetical protein
MDIESLKQKPIWQLTGEEFLLIQKNNLTVQEEKSNEILIDKYVYGIKGIARIFNSSVPTANRIKKSGKIDGAITQIGRKIVVDVQLALELAGRKNGGRK